MKKWILKAIVQKLISYLPFSHRINYIFQKYVTKGVYLSNEYFFDRLGHAKAHLDSFKKYSNASIPTNTLEIGTGWYPIVPISFFLVGVDKVHSVDLTFLTSKERIYTTLLRFEEAHNSGLLGNYISYLPERYATVENLLRDFEAHSLEDILGKLNIYYLVEDARTLSLPDNSIDLVNSNNTFEHIYPELLIPILQDFKRVVNKEHGVMSHFIDMSDHFAHFDKSISIYNFLQFTDRQWRWIDNNIQPQSRLRIYDYEQMFAALMIPISESISREGNLGELQDFPIAAKYLDWPLAETAKSHCHFISDMTQRQA